MPSFAETHRDLKIRDRREPVDQKVAAYLGETKNRFEIGSSEYYARLALEQALLAFREKNYGIGALTVLVQDGTVYEFPSRNAMTSGLGVHDHAEARGLDDCLRYKASALDGRQLPPLELLRTAFVEPNRKYSKNLNDFTAALPNGVHVFGTLEPCPMCMCMQINAAVKSSTSSALDDVAAFAIGNKFVNIPHVWRWIAQEQGLRFNLLNTNDNDLKELSAQIFLETREQIDLQLTQSRAQPGLAIPPSPSRNGSAAFDLEILHQSFQIVREAFPNAKPKAGVVLGTGWLPEETLEVLGRLSYEKIPGLGVTGVYGHAGEVMWVKDAALGEYLIWKGRRHAYELVGSERTALATIPYITSQLQSKALILTQGVGGVSCEPKTFMIVTDHIGPSDFNAFPGIRLDLWRDEFAVLKDLYDIPLQNLIANALNQASATYMKGVYYFWPAKQFQTAAEVRMIKAGGGDVVGKSLVMEAIYANQLGLKVAGLCLVTNKATGLAEQGPDHQFHLAVGREMNALTGQVLSRILHGLSTA